MSRLQRQGVPTGEKCILLRSSSDGTVTERAQDDNCPEGHWLAVRAASAESLLTFSPLPGTALTWEECSPTFSPRGLNLHI